MTNPNLKKSRVLGDGYLETPEGRMSFPFLFKPNQPFDGNGKPKYEVTLLLPPDSDMEPLQKLLVDAFTAKFGKAPKKLSKPPLKRADDVFTSSGEPRYPDFEGWYVLTARTTLQPSVVDRYTKPVVAETDAGGDATNQHPQVYAGAWAKIIINAFGWKRPDTGPNVSFGLSAVQVLRDDERLGGGGSGGAMAAKFNAFDGDAVGAAADDSTAGESEDQSETDKLFGL